LGHASRSNDLLCLEASWARVSQYGLKTTGGAGRMVHMVSSWKSCGVEDVGRWVDATGYIELLYPNFVFFIVLGPKSISVI
jgi:hypothetical protein